uniref:C-type lectin domain-containing protein n=1 Tax=Leptobrachium leishanense TaxID=445787 RepID=A0A8C5MYE1_9ANUR
GISSSMRHIFAYFLLLYWSDLYTLGMLFFPAAPRSSCPPGWFFYKANCYGYFRFRLSWSEAEFECASYGHGAHLASVMDDSEASIIGSHAFAYAATVDIWIGLHDPEQFAKSWRIACIRCLFEGSESPIEKQCFSYSENKNQQ